MNFTNTFHFCHVSVKIMKTICLLNYFSSAFRNLKNERECEWCSMCDRPISVQIVCSGEGLQGQLYFNLKKNKLWSSNNMPLLLCVAVSVYANIALCSVYYVSLNNVNSGVQTIVTVQLKNDEIIDKIVMKELKKHQCQRWYSYSFLMLNGPL